MFFYVVVITEGSLKAQGSVLLHHCSRVRAGALCVVSSKNMPVCGMASLNLTHYYETNKCSCVCVCVW